MSKPKKPDLKAGLDAVTKAMHTHETIVCETSLALALGISKQAVHAWWKRAQPAVPPQRVLDVERVLGIPRHVLRPDIYPKPWKDQAYIKKSAQKIRGAA